MSSSLATESRAVEKIWSVTRTGHRLACELHAVSDIGWDVQLYSDGWMFASRRFLVHTEALEFSAELRRDYTGLLSLVRPLYSWVASTPSQSS